MTSIGSAGLASKLDPPATASTAPVSSSSGTSTSNSLPLQVSKNKDKGNYTTLNINNLYRGKSLETQKPISKYCYKVDECDCFSMMMIGVCVMNVCICYVVYR